MPLSGCDADGELHAQNNNAKTRVDARAYIPLLRERVIGRGRSERTKQPALQRGRIVASKDARSYCVRTHHSTRREGGKNSLTQRSDGLLCACRFMDRACGFLNRVCGFEVCARRFGVGPGFDVAHHSRQTLDQMLGTEQFGHPLKESKRSVLYRQVQTQDGRCEPSSLRHDALILPLPEGRQSISEDALPRPVVDEVFRDAQSRVPLDVAHQVLVPVASVQHLQHDIEALAFVCNHPCHPLVVLWLRHVDDGKNIRRERLFAWVHHGHFFGEVDVAAHGLEVKTKQIDRSHLGELVGTTLGHRVAWVRERVDHRKQEGLARSGVHRLPYFDRRPDGGGDACRNWRREGRRDHRARVYTAGALARRPGARWRNPSAGILCREDMNELTFIGAPSPPDDEARLAALRRYAILDTLPEAAFDDLVHLASELCAAPIALVSLVDRDRQWFKAAVGIDCAETPRSIAFCAHAILGDGLFVVPDAPADPRFAHNPLVITDPHVRFYAGTPLRASDGQKLGALCVLDRVARELTPFQERALRTLGRQVETQLELRLKVQELATRERELCAERDRRVRVERQKEELAEFVVHDLKNPVAAILANAEYLRTTADASDAVEVVDDILGTATVMHRLVLDLLDIRRSDLGDLVPDESEVDVDELVMEVGHRIERRAQSGNQTLLVATTCAASRVHADRNLLRRVLENLLDNALKYVPAGGTIALMARTMPDGATEVEVRDDGPGIPEEARATIFDRYVRLQRDASSHARTSRGLGLAFCRLAVEAHGGSISIAENLPRGTAFFVRLPTRVRPESDHPRGAAAG